MTRINELTNPHRRAIEVVREVAVEKGCRPFLVGGPVRDLLLGRQAIDIDVTLEEGGSTLARALAKQIDGRVRSFPQFLTYKISAPEFPEIDIATARKERYRAPGALPNVSAGKLRDDLLRRDFSINAMAIDLVDDTLHDPSGGEKDLADRSVRVLHDASFIDDPTRIFRAIRLANRLDFHLETHTAALMNEAIERGQIENVSRERIWRELFLAMDEPDAPRILSAFNRHGLLAHIFGTPIDIRATAALEAIRQQIESLPALDRYVLYTGALLRGSDATAVQFEGSGFSQKRARAVLQIVRDVPRFEKALGEADSDRKRFRLYKTVSPEMLSVVITDRPDETLNLARFEEFKRFKLPLRGNDLEVPLGPHVARALERTREAVFTGEIAPDEARTFARRMAMQYLSREQASDPK